MTSRTVAAARAAWVWEAVLVIVLLGLAVLAWIVTDRFDMPHMSVGVLTGAGAMPAEPPSPAAWVAAMGFFLVVWLVMMMAMMLPGVAPVVITVDRWARRTNRPRSTAGLFVAGYLLVWSSAGVVFYAVTTQVIPLLPSGEVAVRAGAVALILAGVYQFTPLKDGCLRQCRSPLAFVAAHATQLRRGGFVGTRVGAVHGTFCLGCCWALMLVLILLGMMSLTWMAAVASAVFLEKVLPPAWPVSGVVGLTLVTAGVAVLVTGRALPAFT